MTNTTLTRMRELAVTDRAELDRLLDDTVLAHVGMADESGGAVVIPTALARGGDRILVHGSTGSGWVRQAAAGRPVCVAVTDLNGIFVARASFESSFPHRGAVRHVHPAVGIRPATCSRRDHRALPAWPPHRNPRRAPSRAGRHHGAGHADPGLVAQDLRRLAHRSRRAGGHPGPGFGPRPDR